MKLLVLLILSNLAIASSVKITDEFIRLLPPSAPNTGGFLTLENTTKEDIKLIKVNGDISKSLELHTLIKDGDTMRMREVTDILIPAKKKTYLKPGGLHLMFMGLKMPLKKDQRVNLELIFDNGEKQKMSFPVLDK